MSEIGEFCDDTVVCEDDTAFTDCLFDKKRFNDEMLVYPDNGRPYVSSKYIKFVINYINRFFCVIALTKTEYFRLEYNEFNKPCKLTHRYSKQSLLEANENIKPFVQDWLIHADRREYINVEFEPDTNVPLRFDTFNLYFGLKIEMMYNITSYDYNMEMVNPFISHITDVFCKGNTEHSDYLLNWIANIVQKPSQPNMVAVVIKSEKQGVGKGLIFDTLLGHGIFGHETYLQVNNVDGLLGLS